MATKKAPALKTPETWEEFCQQTGRDPLALPDTSMYEDKDKAQAIANFKLNLLLPYCCKERPDYTDRSKTKYEIWWEVIKDESRPSGLGLRYDGYGCDYWATDTNVGPRFGFANLKDLKHMATHFIELYIDLLT